MWKGISLGNCTAKTPVMAKGGVVKNAVTRAVKSEPDLNIDSALGFFLYCVGNLEKGIRSSEGLWTGVTPKYDFF